jgi:nicotinate-nucleotide adenylyltransferase
MLAPVRRGILGGTFVPPHVAHLVAAETAYRQLALDVVTLMPAGDPWQKADRRVSDPVHRLAMTELAAAGVGYFEVDDREVRRRGPTYTIETIGSFPADDDIVLILGADAAAGLAGWPRADEVRGAASFAVMPRPGIAADAVEGALRPASPVWLDTPEIAISATELRAMAARGGSIRFLVPDEVWRYVEAQRLYPAGR